MEQSLLLPAMMGELASQQRSVLTMTSIVRVWDFSGSTVGILKGHTDYVYEVFVGPSGDLLSCGEDHTVVSSMIRQAETS
jgi:WD40 repeat protein